MEQLTISPKAEDALQKLQDTKLSPMEEALFQSRTKANQIKDPDAVGDVVDYRGIWKSTGGLVLPYGELKKKAEEMNSSHTLERELQQRMMKRMTELTGKEEDFKTKQFDAERKDVDHKQKMEQGELKLRQSPFDLQMREHDIKGKELDLQKQRMGLDSQQLGNKGKELDLISSLMGAQAAPAKGPTEPRG
jgi:hypothetical protein